MRQMKISKPFLSLPFLYSAQIFKSLEELLEIGVLSADSGE